MKQVIAKLRQKRAKIFADARAINDQALKEKRHLSEEENANYKKAMDEYHALGDQLKREEELDREERAAAEEATRSEQVDQNMGAGETRGETRGNGAETREQREERAFNAFLVDGSDRELRAMQLDSDVTGGYLATPQTVVNRLIKALDNRLLIRQLATTFSIPNAVSLGVPSLDADPADPTWVSELTIGNADSTLALGKRELNPTPAAQLLKVSEKLLRMVPSAAMLVNDRLSYKMAVVQENAFMNGGGANQPLGLFTASNNGISTARDVSTSNTQTAITTDNLKRVKGSLKADYRNRPSTRWIFHRDAVTAIALLKDGNGRYLLQDNIANADGDRLLGIPVLESEYAPNTFTTGLYVGLLGDLSYYWIADALSMTIRRLVELYAGTGQIGFVTRAETDGMPVLGEAFARVKLA